MKVIDQTLFSVDPKVNWLTEKLTSFGCLVLNLHLLALKAWGHFFLIFIGVVLTVIGITEWNHTQAALTSMLQIIVGCSLIFSQKTRVWIWTGALLTVAWLIPLTLAGLAIFGEGFTISEPPIWLKGLLVLLYIAPPWYATYLIRRHRRADQIH